MARSIGKTNRNVSERLSIYDPDLVLNCSIVSVFSTSFDEGGPTAETKQSLAEARKTRLCEYIELMGTGGLAEIEQIGHRRCGYLNRFLSCLPDIATSSSNWNSLVYSDTWSGSHMVMLLKRVSIMTT